MVAKHVNKENEGKPHVLAINALPQLLAALAATCGFILLPLKMTQSHYQSEFWGEFDVSRLPRLGGLPHRETFTWQNLTPAERVT